MKEFQFENETYEVLTLDQIHMITHAKYAGDDEKVMTAEFDGLVHVQLNEDRTKFMTPFDERELDKNKLIPLRHVPREPRSFEAPFEFVNGLWKRSSPVTNENSVWFHCVEIMGENK